jgi:hypothetical protein
MEPLVSQDLRAATIRLAATLPAGSSSRRALLQVLASNRVAAKTGEATLGNKHPEVKRAIEGLYEKFSTLDDAIADALEVVDAAQAALEKDAERGGGEQTDAEEEASEAAGAAMLLLRTLQKLKKQVLAERDDTLKFYKREL